MHINYAKDVLCFCVRVPCGEIIEMRAQHGCCVGTAGNLGTHFFFSY